MNRKEYFTLKNSLNEGVIKILISLSSDLCWRPERKNLNLFDNSTIISNNKANMSLEEYNNNLSRFDPYTNNKLRFNNSTGGIDIKFNNKGGDYFKSNILSNDYNSGVDLDNTVFINNEDGLKNQSNIIDDILTPFAGVGTDEKIVNITSNYDYAPNNEYLKTEDSDIDLDKFDIENLESLDNDEINKIANKLRKKHVVVCNEEEKIKKTKEEIKSRFESKFYLN